MFKIQSQDNNEQLKFLRIQLQDMGTQIQNLGS